MTGISLIAFMRASETSVLEFKPDLQIFYNAILVRASVFTKVLYRVHSSFNVCITLVGTK